MMLLLLSLLLALPAAAAALPQQSEAQKHFERGVELYEVHDDTGDAAREAEAEFRLALTLNPRLAAAIAYLGFLAADRQQPAQAEAAYREALKMDPRCPEARVGMARLHLSAGRHAEALRELRLAVKDHPNHRMALDELALDLTSELSHPTPEMWREAIQCWQTLIRLDRNDRSAHHSLAQAYERFGRWGEAEREYREVLRIGQTDEDMDVWVYSVHNNVAQMLEKQGKYGEAIREYEALIASEGPGEEEIENARARIAALKKLLP